jgi:hypothetical protein
MALKDRFLAVMTAITENADYAESGSVASAKLFASAVRELLFIIPQAGQLGGRHQLQFPVSEYARQLSLAEGFISRTDTTVSASSSKVFSLANSRK